jgi:hypothetical protein
VFVVVAALGGCALSHTRFVRRIELRGHTLVVEKCPIDVHGDVIETIPTGCVVEVLDVPTPVEVDP